MKPCCGAGVFTTNLVKAAPVKWDKLVVTESEYVQAVVVNAGIANACTGEVGDGYCRDMAEAAGKALNIPKEAVLVASTGVIGAQLPMDKIKNGIAKLVPLLGCLLYTSDSAALPAIDAQLLIAADRGVIRLNRNANIDGQMVHILPP